MADTLTGPELLQALISESEDMVVSRPVRYRAFPRDKNPETKGFDSETVLPKKTMVLVIEDADRCLTSRGSDNISAISAILNLSDGIIGNLLDLRIVCTTNAEIDNIDAALMRSGRLSARIEVNLLDVEQAKVIYTRVGGTQEQVWDKKYYSLSDVYALAKGKVIEESPGQGNSRKQKVGFAA
jgi:SpoVK/Ycf46/Vps4 family AAA+-type ATPase